MNEFEDQSLLQKKFEDMSKIERGETPQDIQDKCLKLCAEYLGGVWNDADPNKVTVRRISGGYTNQLYYCGLNDGIPTIDDEPREVTVRFYGQKWFNLDERLSDMVIALLASQNNLGPKVFGVFSEGEIAEYIPSHPFRFDDQKNPVLVKELAKKLAQFHAVDVPLARDCNWLKNYLEKCYETGYKDFPMDAILKETKAETLLKHNIKEECLWLLNCLEASGSPLVFSHNDYRGSNILVHNKVDKKSPRLLTLCDFDYSCYYYRGYDLGIALDEFGHKELLNLNEDLDSEGLEQFVSGYLDEAIKLNGEEYALNAQNSREQLSREARIFSMAAHMFSIMWLFAAKEIPFTKNKNDLMTGAEKMYCLYLRRKAHFQSLGILPNV